ncbi:hypothetical protein BH18ACI3_BH18ACI3_12020 [soil metagenome]
MEKDNKKTLESGWLKDLQIQSESTAFKPEEMVSCQKCGKSNPPTRLSCFYCSTELHLPAQHMHLAKLNLRKLENWEKGCSIIYLPVIEGRTEVDFRDIARQLSIDTEALRLICELKSPAPIVRLESAREAEAFTQNFAQSGLRFLIVSDEILLADKPPVRLRSLEFGGESLALVYFNTGEKKIVPYEELSLIVTGAVFESKIESVEKRKKKEIKVLRETETSSDEAVIDFYSAADPFGYRIPLKGFDFSCLGAEKGLLAAENMRKLVSKLRTFAPSARFVDDYLANKELLDTVWEIDRRKDFHGLQRTGFGRKDFTNVALSNNLQQFTKYSRLQRHLL